MEAERTGGKEEKIQTEIKNGESPTGGKSAFQWTVSSFFSPRYGDELASIPCRVLGLCLFLCLFLCLVLSLAVCFFSVPRVQRMTMDHSIADATYPDDDPNSV